MNRLPYSKEELYSTKSHRIFSEKAIQAAFLLGGIGTGNVSIGARGELLERVWFVTGVLGG